MVQWLAEANILFDVPAAAFVPPPRVTSSVVAILPRAEPLAAADKAVLERVVGTAFGRRRKMLRASLEPLGVAVGPLLEAAGIAPTARPEELSIAQFCALARVVASAGRGCLSSDRHRNVAQL
jgi:16S rRNA (adenine1518-N6/adenine1519-N6)-dimethyltransferase